MPRATSSAARDAKSVPISLSSDSELAASIEGRPRVWLRRAGMVLLALAPAILAVVQLGRIHPDEVFQVLEPALHRARGYGVLSWEWTEGIRNWATPIFVSWWLQLAHALGLQDPRAYRALIAVPQALLHAWMLWCTYRFAERRVGVAAARLSVLLVGLSGAVLVFGGRTLSESLSVPFAVIGFEALDLRDRPVRRGFFSGVLLGLSVVVRYGSAVFALTALVWLAVGRRWRALAWTAVGGAAVAAGLGALDWATWGKPFHSLLAYLQFNVVSGQAAGRFGSEPVGYFVPIALAATPPWVYLALPGLVQRVRQRLLGLSLPLAGALLYCAAISATAHKEERFLYPGLVLAMVAAAPLASQFILGRSEPNLRRGLVALSLLCSLGSARFFPSGDLRGDQFRAIVQVTRRPGTRGLLIVNEGLWGSGGFFYIGQNIPWGTCDYPSDPAFRAAAVNRSINRAVSFEGRALKELQAAGFRVVGQVGRETMLARD